MRFTLATSVLALASAAMGWDIKLYSEEECDNYNGPYSYMTVGAADDLPWCIGPVSDGHFPPGVSCKHHWKNGDDWVEEDCHGQIGIFKSWVVERGNFDFWANYDESPHQNEGMRCSGKLDYEDEGTVFKSENGRCRNAWYHNGYNIWGIHYKGSYVNAYFKGMGAWNAPEGS